MYLRRSRCVWIESESVEVSWLFPLSKKRGGVRALFAFGERRTRIGTIYLENPCLSGKEGLDEILTGVSRAFIVTDKFMHESGMVGYLTEPMEKKGVQYQIFSDVKPDPDIATVTKGIGQLLDFKPQVLFALGGGSSIDAAKAMNWLSVKGGLAEKMSFVRFLPPAAQAPK